MHEYELLVVGTGPGGQRAAIAAAKLGKRVAIVDRKGMVGGVCVNTGTIPSKTLREAVLYLTGMNQRELYGASYQLKDEITVSDLTARTDHVIARESDIVRTQLHRNHVHLYQGIAAFTGPNTMLVTDGPDSEPIAVRGENIVLATGTRPARPKEIEFDGRKVVDSDGVLDLDHLPGTMVVVGAGIIGIEYASMFAALGTRVTVVERRPTMIDFADAEVVEALKFHLRDLSVSFRFNEVVESVKLTGNGTLTTLRSGKQIPAEVVMYSAGRQGVTENLDLEKAGLKADDRGRITVGPDYRTDVPHIYAVGDLIGFPALAATSMEQGRLAAHAAFGEEAGGLDASLMPIGIYTIPEISYVGKTEDDLTGSSVPYEVGISRYRELARGAIVGDSYGMLKLLVCPHTHKLFGVHVFGTNATELVHIGQAIMGTGGTLDYLVNAVFNYPTLSEAYKVAALDALNKMRAVERLGIDGISPAEPAADAAGTT